MNNVEPTDIKTICYPSVGSQLFILIFFIFPVLLAFFLPFDVLWGKLVFAALLLLCARGISLLVPRWNKIELDENGVCLFHGGLCYRVNYEDLRPASSWVMFFVYGTRRFPTLVYINKSGVQKSIPLFHVYGENLEESRRLLSPPE